MQTEKPTQSTQEAEPERSAQRACEKKHIGVWLIGIGVLLAVGYLLYKGLSGDETPSIALAGGDAALTAPVNTNEFLYKGENDEYKYSVYEHSITLTEYLGDSSHVDIPAKLEGKPVTAIDDPFAQGNENIVRITVPEGVTTIGDGAFARLSSLEDIQLPKSITDIDPGAFRHTPLFENRTEEFVIIQGITLIKYNGPGGDVVIPEGVKVVGGFENCRELASVTIPDGVTSIGRFAFFGCNNLRQITLPDSVRSIGTIAFGLCEALQSIELPENLENIEDSAFWQCRSLADLNIPQSVRSIGVDAFEETPWLERQTGLVVSGKTLVDYRDSLPAVTVPDGVATIAGAFYKSAFVETIDVPQSVTWIDSRSLQECENLRTLVIRGKETDLADDALFDLTRDGKEGFMKPDECIVQEMVVYCPPGSLAEEWARKCGIRSHPLSDYVPGAQPASASNTSDHTIAGKYISQRTKSEGVVDPAEFGSFIELYDDGTFLFRENCYEELIDLNGTYTVENNVIICRHNEDISWGAGYWDKQFLLRQQKDGTLAYLGSHMSMTNKGDIFVR